VAAEEKPQAQNTPMLGVFPLWAYCFSATVPRTRQLRTLGATIRQFRKGAGMSQEELAEKADLHPVYVGKVERGEQWISLHALLRVAAALRIRAADLLKDV
jgi:DNA-binding XRE family transcriptional regulator